MPYTFTLGQIQDQKPCKEGRETFLSAFGLKVKTANRETLVSLGDIAAVSGRNGIEYAMWVAGRLCSKREAVALIMPGVERAQAYAGFETLPPYVAQIKQWLSGDDSIDLDAAWRAATDAYCEARKAYDAALKKVDVEYQSTDKEVLACALKEHAADAATLCLPHTTWGDKLRQYYSWFAVCHAATAYKKINTQDIWGNQDQYRWNMSEISNKEWDAEYERQRQEIITIAGCVITKE